MTDMCTGYVAYVAHGTNIKQTDRIPDGTTFLMMRPETHEIKIFDTKKLLQHLLVKQNININYHSYRNKLLQ